MILKEQDDRIADVEALQRLLSHPEMDERGRRRIKEQIRNLESGDLGEAQAAYLLKVHFGISRNWVVINDLRIEHEGLVAQIDHLLINRLLEFWVCESKRFSNGVKINEHGEFITFRDGVPRAAASPIEQNSRHLIVLQHVIASGALHLPTRLGFRIKPQLRSLVLIAGGAIRRPKNAVPGLDSVIMADQIKARIDRAMDTGNPFDIAKVVSQDTLEDIARQVLALHRPIRFDWERRFLPMDSSSAGPVGPVPRKHAPADSPRTAATVPQEGASCADCTVGLSKGVVQFCRRNSERFAGSLLCMECQARRSQPEAKRISG